MEHKIEVRMLKQIEGRSHQHLNIEVIYVLDAEAALEVGEKKLLLKNGEVFLVNSNIPHCVKLLSGTLVCQFMLEYRHLSELLKRPAILYWCSSQDGDSRACQCLREILDALVQASISGTATQYRKLSLYYQLVDCLEGSFAITDHYSDGVDLKEEIIRYINMNYWRPLTLQQAADYVHMSYTVFSKYFKKIAGMNFLEYLNNIRMHFAVEDLIYTHKPITAIAMDHGFSSPSVFNKNFRSSFFMTPTEYRERYGGWEPEEMVVDGKQNRLLEQYFAVKNRMDGNIGIQRILVDTGVCRTYVKTWNQAINLGMAAHVYSAEMQKQMQLAREMLGISYVRICNILDWNMKIRQGHGAGDLNFDAVDRTLDAIVELGLHPFIELGDKPKSVYYNINKIQEEEQEDVFLDLQEFFGVLEPFMEHVANRYGASEVNQWIFELWFNNIKYEREAADSAMEYDYRKEFEGAAKIIKAYAPDSLVGGPGMIMLRIHSPLEELIPDWRSLPYPPDFISMYVYPYWRKGKEAEEGLRYSSRTDFMGQHIEQYRQLAEQWGIQDIPLFITDCNVNLSQRNAYNDSNGKAALLLSNMIDSLEEIGMGLYFPLSDLESVYYDFVYPFSGGNGLLNKEGIPKPVFYAFKFMNQLGKFLVEKGDGYIITSDGRDCFQILCCNYKQFNQNFFLRDEDEIEPDMLDHIFINKQPQKFHFVLKNMRKKSYVVKTQKVNELHGNVLKCWKELGMGKLDRGEVQYLKGICQPKLEKRRQATERGCLHLQENLEAHEIRMIQIE